MEYNPWQIRNSEILYLIPIYRVFNEYGKCGINRNLEHDLDYTATTEAGCRLNYAITCFFATRDNRVLFSWGSILPREK